MAVRKVLWCDSEHALLYTGRINFPRPNVICYQERVAGKKVGRFLREKNLALTIIDTIEQLESLLKTEPFDLLITETVLPRNQSDLDNDLVVVDGYKVLLRLKQGEFGAINIDTPIIILTGIGDSDIFEAIEAFSREKEKNFFGSSHTLQQSGNHKSNNQSSRSLNATSRCYLAPAFLIFK